MDGEIVRNIFHGGDSGAGNIWASILPSLVQSRHDGGYGFGGGGLGAGIVGGVLGGLLFNRRHGFDDNGCNRESWAPCETALVSGIAQGVQGLTNAVPTTALETQIATSNVVGALALGTQQGFSNTKDAIQANTAVVLNAVNGTKDTLQLGIASIAQALCGVNQNVSAQACSIKEAVVADGDRTRALLNLRFQTEDATEINKLNAKVIELQHEGRSRAHHDEMRLQISNTNTAVAAQAQQQQQQQQQEILHGIRSIWPLCQEAIQVARATNSNVIAGNSGAVLTGAQTANPTNVR